MQNTIINAHNSQNQISRVYKEFQKYKKHLEVLKSRAKQIINANGKTSIRSIK